MSETRTIGLDFVRATAIALVLAGHAAMLFAPVTPLPNLVHFVLPAELGVELFFVLSGFLICGLIARELEQGRFRLGRFWTRRWLRTLPNYYLFLLLNLLFERATQGAWPSAWAYAIFMQNFAWPHPQFFGEAWSLCVEEIFYLLAPLVMLGYRGIVRRSHALLPLLGLAIVLFTALRIGWVLAFDPVWDAGTRKIVVLRLDAFVYGAMAMALQRYRGLSAWQARVLLWIGFVAVGIGAIVCVMVDRDHDFFSRTLLFNLILSGFACMLPAAAVWQAPRWSPHAMAAVRALAAWSYSLYVCHLLVMRILALRWHASSFGECLIQAVVFCTLSILCAALVHVAFERPILRWRDRITAGPGPALAAGSSSA